MKFYLDITLLPGADIDQRFLWGKVYQQIHLGLADTQGADGFSAIGVAFPEYDAKERRLGTKLRLFAPNQQILEDFNAKQRLSRLADYVHITSIRPVAEKVVQHARYKRQQSKSNIERLARRKAKRQNIGFEQALQLLKGKEEAFVKAPFIKLPSSSSGQVFPLLIVKEQVSEPVEGGFSCYGLSATSTVPDF